MVIPNTYPIRIVKGEDWGPVVIRCSDANGNASNIEGWSAYAQVREKPSSPCVYLNLAPTVSNGTNGEVTIPSLNSNYTANLTDGRYGWDLFLANGTGFRTGPYLQGPVVITGAYTHKV